MGRAAALLALGAALAAYYAAAPHLPSIPTWADVAFFALVLIPSVFALPLLCLPLRRSFVLFPAVLGLGLLAVLLDLAGAETVSGFAKLGAATALAWWFLQFFESERWVALVALVIPWVDAYSVWRGPTGDIVENRPGVFEKLSFPFQAMGDRVYAPGAFDRMRYAAAAAAAGGRDVLEALPSTAASARLGLPDLLFFALFLGAAARFGLRTRLTWVCLVASFGGTIALTVAFDVSGLPALPGLALGFLLPNADVLWRRARPR